jgi:hypothetical protein
MSLRCTSVSEIELTHQNTTRLQDQNRGRDFEEAMTQPSISLPSRHFRAIRYTFGSLSMGVINEVDAWDPKHRRESSRQQNAPLEPSAFREYEKGQHFSGRLLKNSELVEIKSGNRKVLKVRKQEIFQRAWFSRLNHLYLGVFAPKDGSIRIQDSTVDLSRWETQHQLELQQAYVPPNSL